MIHNRTVKETRRYDIFKLVVLLGLLVLLIFMVWRDDELSRAADGDGTTTAEGAEAAYPAGDEAQSPAGDEAAYPGEDEAAYPAGDGDLDQAPPADAPGYPGADESGDQADDSESGQETASDQSGTGEDTLQILSPAPGAEVQSGSVLFSGTGAAGSQVIILADGNELGQTNVTDNGNWQLEVNIPAGETTIEVQSVDANGSGTTTTPPMDLVVTDPTTDQPPEMTIADDALFAGSSELSGSGIPGTTVAVIVDDQQVATAVVAEDGSWSAPVELATGDQTIVLQTISIEGTIINESEPLEVTVQETINPTVDLPIVNLFAYGMTLTGSGQPNSEVQIIANELPVAETTVNVEGTWTATVNLQAGTYNIDVAALDSSGNPIEQIPGLSLPVLPLPGPQLRLTESSVPEFDPISGVYVWPGVAEPGTEVAVLVDGNVVGTATAAEDGSWSLETELEPGTYDLSLAEMDESGNVSAESEPGSFDLSQQPPTVDLPAESTAGSESEVPSVNMTAGEFTWSGQAKPNSQVAIMIDNETAVTVVADESGNWTAEGELDSGEYELQLAVIDEGGNVISKSEPLPLNVTPAQQPVMNPLELDSSNGNATVSGTTAPNKTVNLVINGAVLESTTSDAGGIYSFAIRLGPGSYEIQVQTVSADGTVEMTSDPETVEVSAVIPAADTEATAEADEDAAETTEPGVEEADVIDAVDVRGEFSTLLTGLESAGLTGQLSDVDEPYTLFAPDDDAFAALPDEVIDGWNQNPESYAEIMFYLVLEGSYTQEQLLQAQVLTTIGGTNIGITTDGETNLVNGVPILESIPAGKSIVHGVEQVILPPIGYDVQPPIINVSGVAVFTGTYLTVVGTAEPGKQILLQVSGENFGEIVTVDENGSWQVADDISPGVHEILAYMLDDNGTLMAISQLVSLPVQ